MKALAALISLLLVGCHAEENLIVVTRTASRNPMPEERVRFPDIATPHDLAEAPRDLGCDLGSAHPPAPPQLLDVSVGPAAAIAFSPTVVSIRAGGTVRWTWETGVHTVTSGVPGAVDGLFCSLREGASPSPVTCALSYYLAAPPYTFEHTFDTTGSYPYFCLVHGAEMVGIVTVTAP